MRAGSAMTMSAHPSRYGTLSAPSPSSMLAVLCAGSLVLLQVLKTTDQYEVRSYDSGKLRIACELLPLGSRRHTPDCAGDKWIGSATSGLVYSTG